jgi:uncharacterized protein YdeI (YjbR/CyaY-like superfamily)
MKRSKPEDGLPTKLFSSGPMWQQWLERNHARSRGAWLKLAKRGSGAVSVSYAEALDVALCFGWIDGRKERCDERYWLQRFTPRSSTSRWSQANRERAEQLIDGGRMHPAGLKAVTDAKDSGRWAAAYASQRRATVPADLARALEARPAARAFFEGLESRNRYAILYRVHDAKKPETRAQRIAAFVEMLEKGERIHPKRR